MHLMVYATYGRTGIYMMQEYCRLLAVGFSDKELLDLAKQAEPAKQTGKALAQQSDSTVTVKPRCCSSSTRISFGCAGIIQNWNAASKRNGPLDNIISSSGAKPRPVWRARTAGGTR